jgi:putative addiction module CopG family antidote
MADAVKAKVGSGEYATESEVIRDGLRALLARDRAIERWLREEVVPGMDAYDADPTTGISIEAMRAEVDAKAKEDP